MNQFLTLLKVDLINSLSMSKMSGSKKNEKHKSGVKGIVFFIIFMYLILGVYSLIVAMMSKDYVPELVLYFGCAMGTLMSLIFTFSNAHAVLFKSKDYELLLSLPIKKRIIIASKLVTVSLLSYLYFSFCYLPSFIFYLIFHFKIVILFLGIIIFLLVPLLILTIGAFLSLFLGLITAKMKRKNLISSLLYMTFILIIMVFSFKIGYGAPESESDEEMLAYCLSLKSSFIKMNPLSPTIVKAMMGNIICLLQITLVSILPFILFLFICSKNYEALNANQKEGFKNKKFHLKEEKQRSVLVALIKREFNTFVSTPVYFTNVILSPVMGAIVMIAGSFLIKSNFGDFFGETDYESIKKMIPMLLIAVSSWCFGLSPATSVSINMEGKKLWIVKSLPLSSKTILWSKILFNMVIYLPFILISSIISIIVLKVDFINSICLVSSPICYCLCFSFVGLFLNTKYYNITWDNPTQAVKQGAGVLLALLIDMGLSFLLIIPIVFGFILNCSMSIVILIFGMLVSFLFGLLCMKKGLKNFEKISA